MIRQDILYFTCKFVEILNNNSILLFCWRMEAMKTDKRLKTAEDSKKKDQKKEKNEWNL